MVTLSKTSLRNSMLGELTTETVLKGKSPDEGLPYRAIQVEVWSRVKHTVPFPMAPWLPHFNVGESGLMKSSMAWKGKRSQDI